MKEKDPPSDDWELWEKYKEKVDPLKEDHQIQHPSPPERKKKPTQPLKFKPAPTPRAQESDQKDLRVTLRSQKRRKITVEAELDLHGMTQKQAYTRLVSFIDSAYNLGKRTVLIITGKGLSKPSPQEPMETRRGVLKQEVPKWLNQSPLRHMIIEYAEASIADGGSGALYVFIRKKKA